jgi:hypothetical protein
LGRVEVGFGCLELIFLREAFGFLGLTTLAEVGLFGAEGLDPEQGVFLLHLQSGELIAEIREGAFAAVNGVLFFMARRFSVL